MKFGDLIRKHFPERANEILKDFPEDDPDIAKRCS